MPHSLMYRMHLSPTTPPKTNRPATLKQPMIGRRPAAKAVLDAAGVTDRCQVVAGDFFDAVPAGADCYVLANVLHDWDDARAARILASCREAMTRQGRVLIVERLIPGDPAEAVPVLLSDINMLVLSPGGRERTNTEYRRLLQAAGLRPGIIRPVTVPYGIIEGLPG
jgi:hypothetical protein